MPYRFQLIKLSNEVFSFLPVSLTEKLIDTIIEASFRQVCTPFEFVKIVFSKCSEADQSISVDYLVVHGTNSTISALIKSLTKYSSGN